jgi:menaquinone-dependent protoporphyrinogen IX oxidase
MRVCVLYCGKGSSSPKLKEIAGALAKGIESQGHTVDVFDMRLESGKIISFYDYIVVGSENVSLWGGKVPDMVSKFLKQAGTISGKRCMAFIVNGGIRSGKTLHHLMHSMESEGMYLKTSDILKKKDYAQAVGKRLHIS